MADGPKIIFNEQTFLLDFFDKFVRNRGPAFAYKNFIQLEGRSAGVINSLLLRGNSNVLKDLTSAQMALLVPKIAIYKVLKDKKTQNITQKRFEFDDFTSVKSVTNPTGRGRGLDAALVSFIWKDMGTNKADSGLSFEATLKLKFSSFDGIFEKRSNGLKFADLLVPSGLTRSEDPKAQQKAVAETMSDGERKIDPTELSIKAVVGWNTPSDPGGVLFKKQNNGVDPLTLFRETQVAFILTITTHDINITESGGVELAINYQAMIEAQQQTPRTDLLKIDYEDLERAHEFKKATIQVKKADIIKKKKTVVGLNFVNLLYAEMKKLNFSMMKSKLAGENLKVYNNAHSRLMSLAGAGTNPNWIVKETEVKAILQRSAYARGHAHVEHGEFQDKKLAYEKKKLEASKQDLRTEAYSRLLCMIDRGQDRLDSVTLTKDQVQFYTNFLEERGTTELTFAGMKVEVEELGPLQPRSFVKPSRRVSTAPKTKEESPTTDQEPTDRDPMELDLGGGTTTRGVATQKLNVDGTVKKEFISKEDKQADRDAAGYDLTYFYFGDIVEAALEILKENPATKNITDGVPLFKDGLPSLLLGTVDIYDPQEFKIHSVPLCDIPISLSLFRNWFYKTIIKTNTTTLHLLNFLKLVATKLIVGALSPMKKHESAKNLNIKLSSSTLLMSKKRLTEGKKTAKNKKINRHGRIPIDQLRDNGYGSIAYADPSQLEQHYFLYIGGTLDETLKGNKIEDEKRGIPHLFIGRDRGMVKRINFKRTDLPFQRQIAIANVVERSRENRLLSDHYSAEVTMVGNALFKPGMLLFIDPSALGYQMNVAKTIKSIALSRASQIGLGGYYMVNKVNNTIESGKFETILEVIGTLPMYAIKPTVNPQSAARPKKKRRKKTA